MNEESVKEAKHEVSLIVRTEEQKPSRPSVLNRINTLTAVATSILKACAILILVLFLLFNLDLLKDLLGGVRQIELFGVKVDIDSTAQMIIEQAPTVGNAPKVSLGEAEGALKRAVNSSNIFAQASILWIDDQPENNLAIRRVFRDLGASITVALKTDEAKDAIRRNIFDVIISDIARSEGKDVAIALAKHVAVMPNAPGFIFYVGQLDSRNPPDGAFAITNRPDELLNLVTDVLERRFYTR